MPINLVITNAGRAALVNATNTGTLPITITQIGLSSVYTAPVQTLTALPSELKRLSAIAGQVVADDNMHVSVKDESTDAYVLRSIALYLGNGTLFACAGQSDPMLNKASSAVALAAFDIAFDDIDAASISFGDTDFMMPTATTTVQGVVELATVAEAQAGIDALRALTPASAKAAVLGWILSQDGSGSGMDADLLDGQHGSWYADIISRLGYTPANKAGTVFDGAFGRDSQFTLDLFSGNPIIAFSPTGSIIYNRSLNELWMIVGGVIRGVMTTTDFFVHGAKTWTAGNDGSGSGLDADVLDGQHGSFYTDIAARLGFTPLNAAAYNAPDVINKLLTVDGAGSGLDADLLDGQQASAFMASNAIGVSNVSDAMAFRLPGGILVQMGTHPGTFPANTDIETIFPVPFASEIKVVMGGNGDVVAQPGAVVGINYSPADLPTLTSFKWRTSSAGQNRLNWLAIGN